MTPDQRADQLASRQYGAIGRRQALEAGLTRRQIQHRVVTRRWRIALPGVYVVVAAPETWQQRAMVALLAAPAGAVLSHLTAAALFGLADPPPVPHLTVPHGTSGRFGSAVVHRSRQPVDPRDACLVGPLRCTAPARTLVDCAGLLRYEALCELVDTALCRRLTSPGAARSAAERASRMPGRKGLPSLRRALEVWASGPRPGSPAEMRLLRCIERWGFPLPERQVVIRDERGRFVASVDLGWSQFRAGFEYEGEEFHGPRRWKADDRRQDRIEALGWRIERVDRFDLRPSSTRLRHLLADWLGPARAA